MHIWKNIEEISGNGHMAARLMYTAHAVVPGKEHAHK